MKKVILVLFSLLLFSQTADAKSRHGICNGWDACRCGVTAARLHGLPLNYMGLNLKMARSYYAFPRTTCHAGAIGIPHAHHVYTVQQCNGDGTALVSDDAGTYTRRIGGTVFVDPNGNGMTGLSAKTHKVRTTRHRRHYARAEYIPPDRMDIH